jgi:hypothetical protein
LHASTRARRGGRLYIIMPTIVCNVSAAASRA